MNNTNGNFVIPKLFELDFQGSKNQQQTRPNILYTGTKPFGKGLVKGPQSQNEPNNVTIGFHPSYETRSSLNKHLNI